MKAYRYRIYPSNKQKVRLLNQFKICKEIYNMLLNENKEFMTISKFDLISIMVDIKKTCPSYYYQVHSQVLQEVGYRLHYAFESFFRKLKEKKAGKKIKVGFPRFKSKIRSITYPQFGFKFLNERKLKVSKIGSIPIVLHRIPRGKAKTMNIKQNRSGQWFASFCCETETQPVKHPSAEKIGIDVGINNFVTLSNGETVDNPKFLIKSKKRIKLLDRRLNRKKKGSANRKKAKFRLARQHLKITNQRSDFLHKLSYRIAKTYSFIIVENLDINSMVKNHYLAKSISDASWGKFIQMLSYKAVNCGGQLVKVNPRGTSKTCSKCGTYVDMSLSKKIFHCPTCGLVLHRDLNASFNIYDRAGLAQISTPVDDCVRPSLLKAKVVEAGTICHYE
ncbi:transposase [Patescibacteria group bacterium]|nr:transposase [Patescibacteria group bacterium]